MKKLFISLFFTAFSIFIVACNSGGGSATSGKVIKTQKADNLNITLSSDDGVINNGKEEFALAFTDGSGNPVKIDAASVTFHMPGMGSMAAMNDAATLTSTSSPGVFKGSVNIEMAGEWQMQVAYEGAAGKGKTTFPVTAH